MFTKLLVPLDRSPLAEQAIGQAAAIARASKAEMDLVLVHQPLAFDGFTDAPWNEQQLTDEHAYLESIAAELVSGSSVRVTHALLKGEAVDMICRRAWDTGADLIVMTSHGRTGLNRAWFGSVADGVLRHSTIPVLTLRPVEGKTRRDAAHHLFKHLLILLDGSGFSADILTPAAALAKCSDTRITLLRIVQPVPLVMTDPALPFEYPPLIQDEEATNGLVADATKQLADVARELRDEGVRTIDAQVVVDGHVARAILEFARTHEIDAIAMATHGRGASRLLMGSVADKVVRASGVPVLVHRPLGVHVADAPTESSKAHHVPAMVHA